MTKNFKKARQMLIKACSSYIQHNQSELGKLMPRAQHYPAYSYFEDALGRRKPHPGFKDWIRCGYHNLLGHIIHTIIGPGWNFDKYYSDTFGFPPLKWKFERCGYGLWPDGTKWDETHPSVVLHNLQSIFNLLKHCMQERIPNLDKRKIFFNYKENDLAALNKAPLSFQMAKSIENLRLRTSFLKTIIIPCDEDKQAFKAWMERNNFEMIENLSGRWSFVYLTDKKLVNNTIWLCDYIDELFAEDFECYLKGVAVQDLKATLENPALSDKEAIKAVEAQLRDGVTLDLLQKNRQSDLEKGLKLLSVITILIGVGIFPTLFLACKRLYDSSGTSINFFKPLSKNLCETIESITEDITENIGNCL